MSLTEIEALARKHSIECVLKSNGHVQLKGDLLVNYYPESKQKTAYVAGTKVGRKHVTPSEAIAMCSTAPPMVKSSSMDKRRQNTRRKREALFKRGVSVCWWCKAPLTLDTSTLEHKIPLKRGGLDNANNRTLACAKCNHDRGHDMPELSK